MLTKRKFFQLTLILIGLFVLFFTYFFQDFKKKPILVEDKKEDVVKKDFEEGEVNKFENVEYQGVDNSGNRFVIGSNYAQFEEERPEIINMQEIECTFYFKDNTVLTIIADSGIFNNITNDMKFSENVKMEYLENILFSDRAIFNNYENQLLVAGNVKGENLQSKLQADELDFDLNTKNLKISMYNDERVNVKTNF
tara:strand:+ start:932 stop:1519 length:588 start_codon:yes stop_codon:yes gene_type:complete